jgi:hypothetical protein
MQRRLVVAIGQTHLCLGDRPPAHLQISHASKTITINPSLNIYHLAQQRCTVVLSCLQVTCIFSCGHQTETHCPALLQAARHETTVTNVQTPCLRMCHLLSHFPCSGVARSTSCFTAVRHCPKFVMPPRQSSSRQNDDCHVVYGMNGQAAAPSQLNRRFDRHDMPNLGNQHAG